MNQQPFQCNPAHYAFSPWTNSRAQRLELHRRCDVVSCNASKGLSVKSKHCTILRLAEVNCTVEDRLKDRLKVIWRAAYHPQDFTCGGLLLQGFGEITVTNFEFLEQPHILDGDHGLVG